jgi:hypothetical protein
MSEHGPTNAVLFPADSFNVFAQYPEVAAAASDRLDRWIDDVCRGAEARRVAMKPTTARFTEQWERFTAHHYALPADRRSMIWRVSALITARLRLDELRNLAFRNRLDGDDFDVDCQVLDKLRVAEDSLEARGADPSPTPDYAEMVQSLMRAETAGMIDAAIAAGDARAAVWRRAALSTESTL